MRSDQKNKFIERFVEACGTAEPAKIQRLLNISYLAAKNYLHGRIPEPNILLSIAEKTPYSLHWLLTGEGEKYARPGTGLGEVRSELQALIRAECLRIVDDMIDARLPRSQKVVVLPTAKIKSEKILPREESVRDHHRAEVSARE